MDRVDRSIREELGRFGPVDESIAEVVRVWPAAVGPTVARNAWPARLTRDGTLHVNTSSSTWAFELGRLAETIAEGLASVLAAPPRALRFAPGPLPDPAPVAPQPDAGDGVEPGPEHRAEAAELTAAIEDERLRASVARAAAASLAKASRNASADRGF